MNEIKNKEQTALHLLDNITVIRNKYDEIAKATGENFNIFSVLHLESDEVRLHSRLLGELLNPKGSHNQNEVFLKLFISAVGLEKQYTNEQIKNAKVIVEENIGGIPDDYSKGGRIDLVIKFPNNNEIVVENKIWAGDQFNQLGRYFEQYKNSNIIYLTPSGKKPSPDSLGNLPLEKVICISYQSEIVTWLELCQKEVYKLPLIREIFSHYINVINKLTNKTNFHQMNDDVSKLIIKDITYFKSANDIVNTFNDINSKIYPKALEILKSKFYKTFGEKFKVEFPGNFNNNLLFFVFKDYEFRLRLSDEFNSIGIWLAPNNKDGKFGVADDEQIIHFKKYFNNLSGYEKPYNNFNYTVMIKCKNDFLNSDIENRFQLTIPEKVEQITDEIISEIKMFIAYFKEEVRKEGLSIEFNF